eukprot:11049746-Alexandrium_andersonii.AAC.1
MEAGGLRRQRGRPTRRTGACRPRRPANEARGAGAAHPSNAGETPHGAPRTIAHTPHTRG